MLQDPIKNVVRNLEALRDFVDLLDSFLSEQRDDVLRERREDLRPIVSILEYAMPLLDSNLDEDEVDIQPPSEYEGDFEFQLEQENDGRPVLKVNARGETGKRFDEAMLEFARSTRRIHLLYYSALMNLTSTVEWYFSQLIHFYFSRYPNAIGVTEKTFSLRDLEEFDTIEIARDHYVQSKVNSILFNSFSDWLHFLRQKANLKMGYLDDSIDRLVETFARRNLVVHNAGTVNSVYLKTKSTAVDTSLELGSTISVDRSYLDERIDLFETSCLLIAFELWKQLDGSDEERGELIADLAYRCLSKERYAITLALCYFLKNDKAMPEPYLLVAELNYWLCKKRTGCWDAIQEEVQAADYSGKDKRYRIALESLRDNKEVFFGLMPSVLSGGDVSVSEFREFPIFEEMRKLDRFSEILSDHEAKLSDS